MCTCDYTIADSKLALVLADAYYGLIDPKLFNKHLINVDTLFKRVMNLDVVKRRMGKVKQGIQHIQPCFKIEEDKGLMVHGNMSKKGK